MGTQTDAGPLGRPGTLESSQPTKSVQAINKFLASDSVSDQLKTDLKNIISSVNSNYTTVTDQYVKEFADFEFELAQTLYNERNNEDEFDQVSLRWQDYLYIDDVVTYLVVEYLGDPVDDIEYVDPDNN